MSFNSSLSPVCKKTIMILEQQLAAHLNFVYEPATAETTRNRLTDKLTEFQQQYPDLSMGKSRHDPVTQADSILITYGDQIQEADKPTLQSLSELLATYLNGIISSVHILPFYPYSSDDGFSVIDYKAVDPIMGDWSDVALLRPHFRLMFDAVINHISAKSEWFQGFLNDAPPFTDYFVVADPNLDLSAVVRPRALPLLTPVETASGTKHVWTTFSDDQIDINYDNPDVLLEIVDVLLFYIANGAEFIRLDAIAFMWKEIGTNCLHLPQTHRLIQLFRTILDIVAPHVMLITETNVPHAENISYFGDGQNEAQMVYNFSLAPLMLHTIYSSNAKVLQAWAATLEAPSETTTFFNFIASHDGIGVRPAEGILTKAEIQHLADTVLAHGGQVSFKNNPDGSQSPYELNVTLYDALSNPHGDESDTLKNNRFMVTQAIMLALAGVPGIYAHSLIGSSNNLAGLAKTGRARTINREKWQREQLEAVLNDSTSRAAQLFQRYSNLLQVRAAHTAFHPNGGQQIINLSDQCFTLLRTAPDNSERVLCLHNISATAQTIDINLSELSLPNQGHDAFSGEAVTADGDTLHLTVEPYGVQWLVF